MLCRIRKKKLCSVWISKYIYHLSNWLKIYYLNVRTITISLSYPMFHRRENLTNHHPPYKYQRTKHLFPIFKSTNLLLRNILRFRRTEPSPITRIEHFAFFAPNNANNSEDYIRNFRDVTTNRYLPPTTRPKPKSPFWFSHKAFAFR